MKLKFLFFAFCFVGILQGTLQGQQSYSTLTIPDNLKSGVAVVRNYEVSFERQAINTATTHTTLVVTVLNNKGDYAAEFTTQVDKFCSLKSFSGEVLDGHGNLVRKIKKNDLQYTEYSNRSVSDDALYYYEPRHPSYPYTVKYKWELSHKNGIFAFPIFDPVPGLQCAVERAIYKLTLPIGTIFHKRSFNMPASSAEPYKNIIKGSDVYEWKLENYPCIEYEVYAPAKIERYPMIFFSPHEFSYDGVTGYMDSWKSYGQWLSKLLAERNVLPDELKQKIDLMTADAASPMEKIKILYDYLAATTRYVSIQIGIGGFQPMTATEVYTTGFGDCKALSNYMQAMLAHCGIKSYYTEIFSGSQRNVLPDFANMYFKNHAILQVPIDDDTLWLECTNPNLPLGYTHNDIAKRYALVVRDGAAFPVMTNSYPDTSHLNEIKAELNLNKDGSFQGNVTETNHMNRYIYRMNFGEINNDERINRISSNVNVATPLISAISYTDNKSIRPVSTISYNIDAMHLGSKTGSRMFINISPLRKNYDIRFGRSARKFPIVVENGYIDRDEIIINLPSGFNVEVLPPPIEIDSEFGNYSLTVSLRENSDDIIGIGKSIVIKRSLLLRSGRYPIENYNSFKSFIDAVIKANRSGIVLKSG
jgi:hypothetical protein